MANWIRVIAIGLIFVLSLFNLRLALQSVDSSSKRGDLKPISVTFSDKS